MIFPNIGDKSYVLWFTISSSVIINRTNINVRDEIENLVEY